MVREVLSWSPDCDSSRTFEAGRDLEPHPNSSLLWLFPITLVNMEFPWSLRTTLSYGLISMLRRCSYGMRDRLLKKKKKKKKKQAIVKNQKNFRNWGSSSSEELEFFSKSGGESFTKHIYVQHTKLLRGIHDM